MTGSKLRERVFASVTVPSEFGDCGPQKSDGKCPHNLLRAVDIVAVSARGAERIRRLVGAASQAAQLLNHIKEQQWMHQAFDVCRRKLLTALEALATQDRGIDVVKDRVCDIIARETSRESDSHSVHLAELANILRRLLGKAKFRAELSLEKYLQAVEAWLKAERKKRPRAHDQSVPGMLILAQMAAKHDEERVDEEGWTWASRVYQQLRGGSLSLASSSDLGKLCYNLSLLLNMLLNEVAQLVGPGRKFRTGLAGEKAGMPLAGALDRFAIEDIIPLLVRGGHLGRAGDNGSLA